MQLRPSETFSVVRQLDDPFDTGTYYVQAKIRDARTDTLITTLNLTDKGSQRFVSNWVVVEDPSGLGRYIDVETLVYTDSGYTTVSEQYRRENKVYLIQERDVNLGGGGVDVDYKRIENLLKENKPEKVKVKEVSKKDEITPKLTEIIGLIKDLEVKKEKLDDEKHTGTRETVQKELNSLRDDLENSLQETRNMIDALPEPEKLDLDPVLSKLDDMKLVEYQKSAQELINRATEVMIHDIQKVFRELTVIKNAIKQFPVITIGGKPIEKPELEENDEKEDDDMPKQQPRKRNIRGLQKGFISNMALTVFLGISALVGSFFALNDNQNNLSVGDTVGTIEMWKPVTVGPTTYITQRIANRALKLSGYSTGCAQFDSDGVLSSTGSNCGGAAGGSNTQVQYNNNGSFGGDSGFTYSSSTDALTVNGLIYTPIVQAHTSAGLVIEGTGGTDAALFGSGGGANSTFYGGAKFDYVSTGTIPYFDSNKNLESMFGIKYDDSTGDIILDNTLGSVGSIITSGGIGVRKGINIIVGASSDDAGADINLESGAGDTSGGDFFISGGDTSTNSGGIVRLRGGQSTSGTDGGVYAESDYEVSIRDTTNTKGIIFDIANMDKLYVFPIADGTNGQVLTTNGSGILSFTTASGGMSIGGSITSATQGSVLFAGATGVLAQDNANFFWDDSNNRLGLGIATPAYNLDILGTSLTTAGTQYTRVSGDAFSSTLNFRKARGTVGAETVVTAGDVVSRIQGSGYDGSAYDTVGNISINAADISGGIVSGSISLGTADVLGTVQSGLVLNNRQATGLGTTPTTANGRLTLGGTSTTTNRSTNGAYLTINNSGIVAVDDSSSGTVTHANTAAFFGSQFAASSATTYTNASTLYIGGAPTANTNVTITSAWSMYVNAGNAHFGGGVRMGSYLQSTNTAGNAFLIYDGGANEMLRLVRTASAVNEHTITNAATGANPQLSATGGDTNVGLDFLTKAAGMFRFLGNSTQAGTLQLFEDTDNGTNFTAFRVGAQAGDITYTLPVADGASSTVLSTNGAGVLSWATVSGGSGTPAGSNTQIQYNNAGAFGASANFTWDDATVTLGFGSDAIIQGTDNVTINAGGDAGGVSIFGKAGTSAGSPGGDIFIRSGAGNTTGSGGDASFRTSGGGTTGDGGFLDITSGNGGATSGAGGSLKLSAGKAQAGNSDGGYIQFFSGEKAGSGVAGNFRFYEGLSATVYGVLDFKNIATTAKTFTFPNLSGTIALLEDAATASDINTGTSVIKFNTPDALAGSYAGTKSLSSQVTGGTTDVTTGDGKAYIVIPESLNGMNLIRAQAVVVTAGTTGTTTVMIHNKTDAVDMLSTGATIASGATVGTAGTINTSTDDVATNDVLRIDVDTVTTTAAKGLMIVLEFRLP